MLFWWFIIWAMTAVIIEKKIFNIRWGKVQCNILAAMLAPFIRTYSTIKFKYFLLGKTVYINLCSRCHLIDHIHIYRYMYTVRKEISISKIVTLNPIFSPI